MAVLIAAAALRPGPAAAAKLSPVELDLLKVRLAAALKREAFSDALPLIDQIKRANRRHSPSLHYFEGITLQNLERYADAEAAYRRYLKRAGNDGPYYQKALNRIVEIDGLAAPLIDAYKKVLKQKPGKDRDLARRRLESQLGDRVADLTAAFWRAEAQRRHEESVDDVRHAIDRAARRLGYWERTLRPLGPGFHGFTGVTALPDGGYLAVGKVITEACGKIDNWWAVTLDAAGDVVAERNHCPARGSFGLHSFFRGVSLAADGNVLTGGVSDTGQRQIATAYKLTPAFEPLWKTATFDPPPGTVESYLSLFLNTKPARDGGLLGAGFAKLDGTPRGALTLFGGDGGLRWSAPPDLTEHRKYHDADDLGSGRYVAVGVSEEPGGLFTDGGTFSAVDLFREQAREDDREPPASLVRDAALLERGGAVFGVAGRADGGFVTVGRVDRGETEVAGATRGQKRTIMARLAMVRSHAKDGTAQWIRLFGREGGNNRANKIINVGDGYIVVGNFHTADAKWDGWIFKVDLDGDLVWSRTYGGPGEDWLADVKPLPRGKGFVAAGVRNGAGWILKLDPEGRLSAPSGTAKVAGQR